MTLLGLIIGIIVLFLLCANAARQRPMTAGAMFPVMWIMFVMWLF